MKIIKHKRGLKGNMPTLIDGEIGFTTDTNELFIGNGGINIAIGSQESFDHSKSVGNPHNLPIDATLSTSSVNPIQNKAITTALNEKGKIFATTVGTTWEADETSFKQQINIAGMKVTYNPTVSLNINDVSLDVDSMRENMAKIYRIETYDGYIIVKAKEKTMVELPLVLKA